VVIAGGFYLVFATNLRIVTIAQQSLPTPDLAGGFVNKINLQPV
jgi:hypothetical protein